MGFLTGDPATSTSTSSSQTNTYVDPGGNYYPLEQSVLGVAQGLLNRPWQGYDVNQRFAGFTPQQTQAFQGVSDAQGNWQPAFNQAQGNYNTASAQAGGVGTAGMPAFNQAMSSPSGLQAASPWLNQASQSWTNPGVAQQWMNPFQSQVTQATADQANRAFTAPGGPLQGLTDAFSGGNAGQFGRERMGDVANQLTYNYGQGLGSSLASTNMAGYNQGMTAFGNQQQLYGNLGSTAGQLGLGGINAYSGLGSNLVNQANTGVTAGINAGAGQTAFGTAQQANNYRDLNALMSSGATQQAFGQQQADFNYQQFLQQQNWGATNAALAQSLAQGWQLPTQTNTSSQSTATSTPATGSILGQILGGGMSIAGLGTGNGGTVGGNVASWLGKQFAGGGPVRAFGAGGYAPVVSALRRTAQQDQPAQMQRLQAFQQQQQGPTAGVPPPGGAPPGMAFPPPSGPMPGGPAGPPPGGPPGGPAFARGGAVHDDEAQDRALIGRMIAEHMGQRRFAFGGYADGGDVDDYSGYSGDDINHLLLDDSNYPGIFLHANQAPDVPQRAFTLSPEERHALRTSRALVNTAHQLRDANEDADVYRRDPGGTIRNAWAQVPHAIASTVAPLAGIPGTAISAFGGHTSLPTVEDIEHHLSSAFGDPQTHAARAINRAVDTGSLATGVGEAARPLMRGYNWLRRFGTGARHMGDAANLASAFGGE